MEKKRKDLAALPSEAYATEALCVSRTESEFAIHYVRVGVTVNRVQKRLWEISHDLKTMPLPQPHRPVVGADHKVELHCLEVSVPGTIQ
jgi:hypothetical protein